MEIKERLDDNEPAEEKETYSNVFRNHSLFKNFSEKEIEQLYSTVEIVRYSPNELLFEEGSKGKDLYIVLKGDLDVLKWNEQQQISFSVDTLKSNDLFGEMAFLGEEVRTTTVVANNRTVVAKIFYDETKKYSEIHNKLLNALPIRVITNLKKTNKKLVDELAEKFSRKMRGGEAYLHLLFIYLSIGLLFQIFSLFPTAQRFLPWLLICLLLLMIQKRLSYPIRKEFFTNNWPSGVATIFLTPLIIYYTLTLVNYFVENSIVINAIYPLRFRFEILPTDMWLPVSLYAFSREIIGRGITQPMLQTAIGDKKGYRSSVMNALFLTILYFPFVGSVSFAAFAFPIAMALLFNLQKNLLVVCLLHTLMLISGLVNLTN